VIVCAPTTSVPPSTPAGVQTALSGPPSTPSTVNVSPSALGLFPITVKLGSARKNTSMSISSSPCKPSIVKPPELLTAIAGLAFTEMW